MAQDFDIAALMNPEQPRQTQRMAALLRGQRALGNLGMLTGDRVLAPQGQALVADAQQQQQAANRTDEMRLSRALEAAHNAAQQKYQNENLALERERNAQQARFQRDQLAQDAFAPVQTGEGVFILNKKKGEAVPLTTAGGAVVAAKGSAAQSAAQDKEWQKFANAISTTTGRGNLNRERQETLDRADRLEALVRDATGGKIQDLTPQQVREAASALANLISKNSAAVSQIEELTPQTLSGRFANAKQYLLNEPAGAGAQAFLENMLDTAAREKKVIRNQILRGQAQSLPAFAGLIKADPARAATLLKANNMDPARLKEGGEYDFGEETGQPEKHPQADQARQWVREHPDDPRAKDILKRLGMAP